MKLIDEESEERSVPFVATIIVSIVIGLVGVYLRFADFPYSSQVADIIFGIAIILVFKTVFGWLKVTAPRP
jgi:hypothetical protein